MRKVGLEGKANWHHGTQLGLQASCSSSQLATAVVIGLKDSLLHLWFQKEILKVVPKIMTHFSYSLTGCEINNTFSFEPPLTGP